MKFSIYTLGCKVNQSESDVIEGTLLDHGHSLVGLSENPDYCIVNTCSVTAKSDYQSRQLIRRALRSSARVIATGCYAQLRSKEIRSIDQAIHIVNNSDKYNIVNIIDDQISEYTLSYSQRSRPSVKVQDGCNNTCSFCIVPLARGKSRSINASNIVNQVHELEEKGYREIVLTGIHLGSYGKDLEPTLCLSHLVEMILKDTKTMRIRLSSLGVHEIDRRLEELLQENRICRHLHIPLQSGDDTILRRMNRPYDTTSYLHKVTGIHMKIPDISIGTDVIVGFPGESDETFLNVKSFIDQIPFAYLHIFPYSNRPGSKASGMHDQITFPVKKRRYDQLSAINNRKRRAFMDSQIKKTLDIIIEDEDRHFGVVGTSGNYLKIAVYARSHEKKSLISVRVTERVGDMLKGEVVEKF
jgi:threonylcarbamoyladenosine tRNA methylthiotransferase MtaB